LRWLRLLNVRTHVSLQPVLEQQFETQTSDPLFIYRDPQALPRAFFVSRARAVSGDEAVAAISGADFDPRQEVLLEGPVTPPSSSPAAFAPASIEEYRAERVVLRVDAPEDGYLVLMDPDYPGWHATVDGTPTAHSPANWVGRAVPVSRGSHRVEMAFRPASVRVGLFITLAALAGCFGMAAARYGRKSKSARAAAPTT
jgi:hypothetical protein